MFTSSCSATTSMKSIPSAVPRLRSSIGCTGQLKRKAEAIDVGFILVGRTGAASFHHGISMMIGSSVGDMLRKSVSGATQSHKLLPQHIHVAASFPCTQFPTVDSFFGVDLWTSETKEPASSSIGLRAGMSQHEWTIRKQSSLLVGSQGYPQWSITKQRNVCRTGSGPVEPFLQTLTLLFGCYTSSKVDKL